MHASIPSFDNRFRFVKGHRHLTLSLGGMNILYAYIRKNGCSSFKSALSRNLNVPASQVFRHARAKPFGFYDAKIFVWRDPEDRLISLYRNKILDRQYADDMIARYWATMGEAPSSFERFALFATTNADPHLLPQMQHLRPIRYTHAIELCNLHLAMVGLVGEEAAGPFRTPVNVSRREPVQVTPYARALIHRHYRCDFEMIETICATPAQTSGSGIC